MALWSLTFEKVEEIKKQLAIKIEELEELRKTTIEMMWDRDLEALLKGLDDIDQLEAEEAEAMANATDERRRKKGGRGGLAAPPPPTHRPAPRRGTPDDEGGVADRALLRKPLREGVSISTEGMAKTTWGTGERSAQKP